MYATYTYNAGTTLSNLIADVTAILTGTTDKALLSADCDQVNTEILTTYDLAGWTLHDAAAGTNAIVLSAPQLDVGTKYAVFDFNTSPYIKMQVAEDWNATTHIGTNVTTGASASYQQRFNLALGGKLYISASAQRIGILSFQASVFGGVSLYSWSLIGERERGGMFWDTLAAAYPLSFNLIAAAGISGTSSGGHLPRAKSTRYIGDTVNCAITVSTPNQGWSTPLSTNHVPQSKVFDVEGNLTYAVVPLVIMSFEPWLTPIPFSVPSDVWFLQPFQAANLDEIVFNGKNRVVWLNQSNNSYGSLLFPKG